MSAIDDAPSDGSEYVRKNGLWSVPSGGGSSSEWGNITGDLEDQTDLQDAFDAKADKTNILYFPAQTVSVASSAQIMRIPASGTDSRISTDTVVLECNFANLGSITSAVSWTSYSGYIEFSGTCTSATTANVVLGTKGN